MVSHQYIFFRLDYRSPAGFDRTRNAVIGNKDIQLTYLEEAYTSEHWLVRIYRYKSNIFLTVTEATIIKIY